MSRLIPLTLGLVLVAISCLTACSPQAGAPLSSDAKPSGAQVEAIGGKPTAGKPTPAPGLKASRVTAREAWRLAAPEVDKWQKAAKIAIGSRPTSSKDFDLSDGRSSGWYFICASPDEQHFRRFTVDTSGPQPKIRAAEVESRPAVTAMTDPPAWQIDSPEAYEIAMANGLKQWLAEHPSFSGKDAVLELRGLKEIGSYWLLICHDDKDTIEFQISATDGKVHQVRSH